MTTYYPGGPLCQPCNEQRPHHGATSRQRFARLLCAVVLAMLVILSATGCGRHVHVTFHAGQQTASHVTSQPGR